MQKSRQNMRITIMIKSTGMTNMDTANVMDMKNAAAISHMTNRSMDTVNVMDATVMHITDMNTTVIHMNIMFIRTTNMMNTGMTNMDMNMGMTNTGTANVIHMSTKSVTDMDIIMQMRFLLADRKSVV